MTAPLPQRVHSFVLLLAGAAVAVLFLNTFALAHAPPPPTASTAFGVTAFLVTFIVLERLAVSFVWRGHRVTTALTETAVYMGYLILTPPVVVLLVPVARAAVHFAAKRPPIKGVFNVAHQTLAAGMGAAAFVGLTALGVPAPFAAFVATALYSVFADTFVAALFAVMERVGVLQVYRERFLRSNALALFLGLPAGVALYALHSLHPAATFVALPILYVLVRHSRLQAAAERELGVRRRLADEARELVGTQDEEIIARQALATVEDLLAPARVQLRLADGRTWTSEAIAPPEGRPPVVAPLIGRGKQTLGHIQAWARPMKPQLAEDEAALLHVVAGQAAHAFESARAMAEVAAQRDVMARQEKLSALGTLLAGVAHEVNNPLSYMRLRLTLTRTELEKTLASDGATPEMRGLAQKMLTNLEVMHRGVERLAGLSHSLKVVAKPGDGQRRDTDLNLVVKEVMTVLSAAEREVTYEVELATEGPHVLANADELHQVVLNLVKNATEALRGRSDAKVVVGTRSDKGTAYVTVADNGPGIPEALQSKLFTPFFTTKEKGTGLGLSISHQIVAAHGGELRFETGPTKGTTFFVRLPAAG